jgi:hypothetical protein
MARGDFFSGSERRDDRIAGNISYPSKMPSGPYYGGESQKKKDFIKKEVDRFNNFLKGPGGTFKVEGEKKPFFSQEVGQITNATTDLSGLLSNNTVQPLSQPGTEAFNQELNQYEEKIRESIIPGHIDKFGTDELQNLTEEGKQKLEDSYKIYRDFNYQRNPLQYQQGVDFSEKEDEKNILQKVGTFLANTFTQPVAAGTLDANQQVSQESERPKLSYVNPDAKTMSLSQIADAFKPKNLFGYQDKFGRFDDPGSPLARDRAETMQRVAQNFSSPIVGDARTIAQIRADQEARMRENARLRNESFQRGERVQQRSADVTYGTNMLSNPAFGFRDKMTDDAKAKYDQSAKDATEMAKTDPSLGNVAKQTFNRVSGFFGGPQTSLESVGERQLRLANKEINRPAYQKEAYARKMLGITNDQLKARNLQQIRANATARNQAFQAERRAKAVEKAARKYGQNTGSGRKGGFGSGTVGKGMPSNPGSQRQTGVGESANNLNRHQTGFSGSKKSGGKKGGGGTGGGGGGGGNGGGGNGGGGQGGGPSSGQNKSLGKKNRVGRKVRCDVRTKIDITQLTNQNLIKDDLATVAYFVQELKGE